MLFAVRAMTGGDDFMWKGVSNVSSVWRLLYFGARGDSFSKDIRDTYSRWVDKNEQKAYRNNKRGALWYY